MTSGCRRRSNKRFLGINLKILYTWEPEKARKRGDGKPPLKLDKGIRLRRIPGKNVYPEQVEDKR